jgi:Flp pilus assembly protein TadD
MLRALGDYTRLIVFPHKLHMERTIVDPRNYSGREQWRVSASSEYLSLLGGAALVAFVVGCSWRGRGQSIRVAGAGWFVIAYLPVSNLVDLNATVAEHWLYLASVGFLLFLAGVAIDLTPRWQRYASVAACLAAVALGARSYSRSSDWVDPETFYRRTIEAGGVSARVGSNYGNILANKGDYAGAEKIFRRVLAFAPDYPIARNNLADVCLRLGKKAEAETIFAQAAQTATSARSEYPRTWIAALNLAKVQHKDDPSAALATLKRARKEYPRTWDIFSFEAEVLRRLGRVPEATELVQEYASANWWHYGATLALGRLYTEAGDISRAEEALLHASRLDVHEVEALNMMAKIKLRHDQFAEAYALQRRAVVRQPNQPRQYLLLAEILAKMGRAQEAKSALAHLRKLELIAGATVVAN